LFLIDFKDLVGYGSSKIYNVQKTFTGKTSSRKFLYSPDIEISGNKWQVEIKNKDNTFFGMYLFREHQAK